MILPLAMITHLAAACAQQVAPGTLTAIARVESALDPLAIRDNTTGRSYWPQTRAGAVAAAARLLAGGHSIDAGLMGINAGNWRWLGLTAETVFDPCRNIRAGARVLVSFSRYNTGSPSRGFRNGYVGRVAAAAGKPFVVTPAPHRAGARHTAPASRAFDPPPGWNVFPDSPGPGRLPSSQPERTAAR